MDFPNLSAVGAIAYDVETNDPGLRGSKDERPGPAWAWARGDLRDGYVIGYAVATHDREWYFPVRHETGGNLPAEGTERYLRDLAARTDLTTVFHVAEYDVGWSKVHGIEFGGRLRDTARAAALLDERVGRYSLDACCARAALPGKDERGLVEACLRLGIPLPDPTKTKSARKRLELERKRDDAVKSNLWRLHADDVAPYARRDVRATYDLGRWQKPRLDAEELTRVYDLECDLIRGLVDMRRDGIRVDIDGAEALHDELVHHELAIQTELRLRFGVSIAGPKHAESIAAAFDKLRIPYGRTAKKALPSFPDDFLKDHPHPIAGILKAWRHVNTVRTLNLEGGILRFARTGRIHPEWNALRSDEGGAVTGRIISSHPNVTQMSGRTPLGKRVRALFLPEADSLWAASDISQQEPRLIVHYAYLLGLTRAAEARDKFAADDADWHTMVAEMTGLSRDNAKPINLGSSYGQGNPKLAVKLGISEDESRPIFDQYHEQLPFIRELTNEAARMIRLRGYVRTYLGRRVRFDRWEPNVWPKKGEPRVAVEPLDREAALAKWGHNIRRAYTYRGANGIIQGSGADWLKLALRELFAQKLRPMLVAHDETGNSVASTTDGERVATIIREAIDLKVRKVVECGVGPNWRDAKA